jgi:hypothetical protein
MSKVGSTHIILRVFYALCKIKDAPTVKIKTKNIFLQKKENIIFFH